MTTPERNLAMIFKVRCSRQVCVFRGSRDGRIQLCEYYSYRSSKQGKCSLTGEALVVRTHIDGLAVAKRGKKCLAGEHLWEELKSSEFGLFTGSVD